MNTIKTTILSIAASTLILGATEGSAQDPGASLSNPIRVKIKTLFNADLGTLTVQTAIDAQAPYLNPSFYYEEREWPEDPEGFSNEPYVPQETAGTIMVQRYNTKNKGITRNIFEFPIPQIVPPECEEVTIFQRVYELNSELERMVERWVVPEGISATYKSDGNDFTPPGTSTIKIKDLVTKGLSQVHTLEIYLGNGDTEECFDWNYPTGFAGIEHGMDIEIVPIPGTTMHTAQFRTIENGEETQPHVNLTVAPDENGDGYKEFIDSEGGVFSFQVANGLFTVKAPAPNGCTYARPLVHSESAWKPIEDGQATLHFFNPHQERLMYIGCH